jgi:hypothetical protein
MRKFSRVHATRHVLSLKRHVVVFGPLGGRIFHACGGTRRTPGLVGSQSWASYVHEVGCESVESIHCLSQRVLGRVGKYIEKCKKVCRKEVSCVCPRKVSVEDVDSSFLTLSMPQAQKDGG